MPFPFSDPPADPAPAPVPFQFPILPIVTPDPTPPPDPRRRTEREKYGGLFTLGALGLVVVIVLVGWFAWGLWSHRAVWSNVYLLHDSHRSEAERVQAAFALSRDPRVNQRQLWEMCLRTPLPPLARYILAEALTAEAAQADPRAYALAVARSEGWPDWLRLLLLRPMAFAAVEGTKYPDAALDELRARRDPVLDLWATCVLAAQQQPGRKSEALRTLKAASERPGPARELARLLLDASDPRTPNVTRRQNLDRATLWIRANDPRAAALWEGWIIRGDRLIRRG